MSDYYKEFDTIEDFIFDNSFVDIARKNDQNEIDKLLLLYPDKEDIIKETIILLQYLKIQTPDITEEQIDQDWNIILQQISETKQQKRNKRFYLSAVATIAACAAIFFFIFFPSTQKQINVPDGNLFSLMESATVQGDDIQIIAGNNQASIGNDETIIQTEEGSLLVGKEHKMESSSIKTEYLTAVVPKGKRTTVKLNDGSVIWVNSGTKIVYPKVFSDKSREILIDGEAYLNVAKDEGKPFIVRTKGFDVKVLGTQFNISAYSSDKENSVVLVKGAVEVIAESSKGKLLPNQGFFTENGNSSIKNVDVYPYLCWKDEVMQLDGESLDVIMRRLSRYYGLDIQCDKKFVTEKYRGKIDLKEPIETVLHNLSLSTPLSYTKAGDIIYVR